MDKLVEHLFVFDGNGNIRVFPGNYSDYRNAKDSEENEKSAEQKPEEKKKNISERYKTRMNFNEKREFENLEKEIPKLEEEKKLLTENLQSGSSNHEDLRQWGTRLQQVIDLIDEKSMRWLELSEKES